MPVVALKSLRLGSGALGLVFTSMGISSLISAVVLLPLGPAGAKWGCLARAGRFIMMVEHWENF